MSLITEDSPRFVITNTQGLVCERMLDPAYENWILPYFTLSNKVVLGGSLAMKIMGLMEFKEKERQPDLDFSLIEPFTSNELATIVDFFDLRRRDQNPYTPEGKAFVDEDMLKNDLLLFMKTDNVEVQDIWDNSFSTQEIKVYNVDFFNHVYLKERDFIPVTYKTHNGDMVDIKLTHPSIILAAKAKYAFDIRVGKQFKHWEDLEELFHRKNSDKYFKTMKQIHDTLNKKDGKLI